MNNKLILSIMLFITFSFIFLNGCNKEEQVLTNIPEIKSVEKLRSSRKKIDKNLNFINNDSENIIKNSEDIKEHSSKSFSKEEANYIHEKTDNIILKSKDIKKSSDIIRKETKNIEESENEINSLITTSKKVEKERDDAIKERDIAIQEKNSQLQKMLRWLILICIVGAGISFFFFIWLKSTTGIMSASACIIIMFLSIFVNTYISYLAIFGGVLILFIIILFGWQVWNKKEIISDLVNTVELTKDNLDKEKKEKIFGKDGEVGMMSEVQKKKTMDEVKREKKKISPLWQYYKNSK